MRLMRTLAALILVSLLAACQGGIDDLSPKANKPLPAKIVAKMKAKGMEKNSPIYFRLFKDEHVVEVWKQKVNGKFEMIQNYNICAWSGTLGPKYKEGDRQAPEGFYAIKAPQMNPASQYYLSINTGFPNTYDRAHGRTGAHLMLHGACSSSGCYSLTDDNISEVFAFARDAFAGGQQEIILEALPFRMTPEKMALYSKHKDFAFWQMIKEGYDYFELTKTPPKVGFCEKKYAFNKPEATNINAACPAPAQTPFAATYASYQSKYQSAYAAAAKKFEHTPFPIVMGGKSRPLDKKWEPQPVKPAKTAQLPKPVKIKEAKAEEEVATDAVTEPLQDAAAATAEPVAAAPVEVPSAPVEARNTAAAAAVEPTKVETAAGVPVPTANPNAPVAEDVPAEPTKKKRRLWPFGNDS
jgi:murein L,D-transpeptidase YafK